MRHALYATWRASASGETADSLTSLRTELRDYWSQREALSGVLRYLSAMPVEHWRADAASARVVAGAVENDHVRSLRVTSSPMTPEALQALIANGEHCGLEFKRDDVRPERLATVVAAMLNLDGGHVLPGVEDDGTVSGLNRPAKQAEEWVMTMARDHVRPAPIPYWQALEVAPGQYVGVISLPDDSPDKPYKAKRGAAWVSVVRVGTVTRDATDDEEMRLYQQFGRLSYDIKPVIGATEARLGRRRLVNYFRDVRQQAIPDEADDAGWTRHLVNTDMLVENRDRMIPTVAGMLAFGREPHRFLPQSGITAVAYKGVEKDYETTERSVLRGPLVGLRDGQGELVESGLIDKAIEFVHRNTRMQVSVENGPRQERWDFPLDAVREAVVNAVAHRDYTITVTDIELSVYADRLEVISPGRLPNTVTVDKMRAGYRATRNELVKDILRDYRYIEATGLGVPRKIIAGMRLHNSTEPDLIEADDRLTVRL